MPKKLLYLLPQYRGIRERKMEMKFKTREDLTQRWKADGAHHNIGMVAFKVIAVFTATHKEITEYVPTKQWRQHCSCAI